MIWDLMEGQRLMYGAAIVALVFGSCFMYLVPLVPQITMDGVLSSNPEEASAFVQRAVQLGGGRVFLREHLWLALLCVVALTSVAGAFTYLRGRWSAMASERTTRKVRNRLYDQLQHLPCSYHDSAETGDQVQRCTSDVETLRRFLANQVVEIGRAMVMILAPIPLMLALDVRMTIVSVVSVPPIVVFSFLFFRRVRASFKLVDEAEGRMTSTLQENLTGIRVVRAFARQEHEQEKFERRNRAHRDLDFRLYKLFAWYWSISDFLCMGQKALVVGAGGYWLALGHLQVGTFFFFLAAVNMFIWPVRMMGRILSELGKALVAIGRIGEILQHPRESEPQGRAALALPSAWTNGGEIIFDRVSFAHNGGEDALREVSFAAAPGETVALLGPSGSGKSTIVNLLLRFYDPDSGAITIDGVDVLQVDRKEVRSRISVVMQEPFLYSKTIGENIRLGRAGAAEDEITEAAATACVHDAILEFDDGYRTMVGERGVTLSGGQRQRVALARALLDDPSILILDDALSSVDTETEAMILEALRSRKGRHTTLVIAHRLSTLMHADRILVMDRGRVVQRGTHESLVREAGLYQRLWQIQSLVGDGGSDGLAVSAGTTVV
jgi:ATP-binding cassette subfamily B protein